MRAKKGPCPICGKGGHEQSLHVIEDSWLYQLIKQDKPEWVRKDGACPRCIAFYKKIR